DLDSASNARENAPIDQESDLTDQHVDQGNARIDKAVHSNAEKGHLKKARLSAEITCLEAEKARLSAEKTDEDREIELGKDQGELAEATATTAQSQGIALDLESQSVDDLVAGMEAELEPDMEAESESDMVAMTVYMGVMASFNFVM
ncbi:hypothetical protein V5O48_000405, partial [Marasmius crinis-equi]